MQNELRVAWLIPAFKYYWQPAIIEFAKYFPNTTVFTGFFSGFIKGIDVSRINIKIEVVGEFKPLGNKNQNNYSSKFTYLSPKIVKRLIRFKPNVIFTSSFGIWTIIALLFKRLYGWKVIIAYEGSSPSVDFCNSPLRLFVRRNMVKAADAYISNSQKGKEYLINLLNAPSDLVFSHPYEIPPLELLSQTNEYPFVNFDSDKKPIFLYVGQVIRRKGLDLLLDACIELNQREQNNYTVFIVGEGEERVALEEFCKKNNLQNNIKWLGLLDYEKLHSLYLQADIFVFPTREDTWGLVVLEAMLFGEPIICSSGAGSSELVREGENGYVFDINFPDKLVELMGKFIVNPTAVKEMGICSKNIMKNYTPQLAGLFLKQVLDSCWKT